MFMVGFLVIQQRASMVSMGLALERGMLGFKSTLPGFIQTWDSG